MAHEATDPGKGDSTGADNYLWTCTVHGAGLATMTAEEWLRGVWEDAPRASRMFLRVGWRFGLGLRLGPADPSHVLGWHIDASTDQVVVVSATSFILSATNTLTVEDDLIRWQTDVSHGHVIGRLVWRAAALVHQRFVPWSVRRAIRSHRRVSR
ncbi:MAG: hypothetical protein ABIZ69_09850 [Ilumatobacteraceae bacterium]